MPGKPKQKPAAKPDSASESESDSGAESRPAPKKTKPKPKPQPKAVTAKPKSRVAATHASDSDSESDSGSDSDSDSGGSGSGSGSGDAKSKPKSKSNSVAGAGPSAAASASASAGAGARTFDCVVSSSHHNERADAVLPALASKAGINSLSRSFLQKLIKNERVSVNGHVIDKAGTKLKAGDRIRLRISESDSDRNAIIQLSHSAGSGGGGGGSGGGVRDAIRGEAAVGTALSVIYEDSHLLLVDKPRGMVVHPSIDSASHFSGTLVHALLHRCGGRSGLSSPSDDTHGVRPGIVHRIDKDTSGILIIAKTNAAHTHLKQQFAVHSITRRYVCWVTGIVKADAGTIDTMIGRHPTNRKKRAVLSVNDTTLSGLESTAAAAAAGDDDDADAATGAGGGGGPKRAITHFRVIDRYDTASDKKRSTSTTGNSASGGSDASGYSLVEATLETGRTHQVRVHMKHLTHPILNDPDYGVKPPKKLSASDPRKRINALLDAGGGGQLLHARVLGFTHPATNQRMYFEASLPPIFVSLAAALQPHCRPRTSEQRSQHDAETRQTEAAINDTAKSIAAVKSAPAAAQTSPPSDVKAVAATGDSKAQSASKPAAPVSATSTAPAAAVTASTTYTLESGETLTIGEVTNSGIVGHTVWRASQLLARYFEGHKPPLASLVTHPPGGSSGDAKSTPKSRAGGATASRWVDLGAGTGLLSLVLQRIGCRVLSTDVPDVLKLLHSNVKRNTADAKSGGSISVHELIWGVTPLAPFVALNATPPPFDPAASVPAAAAAASTAPAAAELPPYPFDGIVAVDVTYHERNLLPLLHTIDALSDHRTFGWSVTALSHKKMKLDAATRDDDVFVLLIKKKSNRTTAAATATATTAPATNIS